MTISTNTEALNATALATRAIHAGQEPDPTTGAVVTPIYMTSTFKQDGVGGLRNGYDYSRSINPTRNSFDEQLAAVEGAKYALSFSSGLAAIDVLLRSTLKPGDNILLGNDVYGGTYRLLSKVFVPWGIGLDVVDITDTAAVSAALAKKQYAYIWVETPSNPLLNITDIAATAAVAHAHGTKVVVDNTFASPVLQHPLADGADVVVYSTTKYIGGHSDVVGGAVVLNDKETRDAVAFLQNAAGAVPSPFDSWLDIRGLKTLDLRVKQHSRNAMKGGPVAGDPPRSGTRMVPGPRIPPGPRDRRAPDARRFRRHDLHPDRRRFRSGQEVRRSHRSVHPGRIPGRRGIPDRASGRHDPRLRGRHHARSARQPDPPVRRP
jgi:cystathionine gamma-synthase